MSTPNRLGLQSLKNFQIKSLLLSNDIDVLCISESLLEESTSMLHIENYKLYRQDITKPGSRGLAIFVRSILKVTPVNLNIVASDNVEVFVIKIQAEMYKSCIVSLVCRRPCYIKNILNKDHQFFC